MMRTFSIEGRNDSPRIFISEAGQSIEISGNSTLKETNWYYCNLLKWMIALNSGHSKTAVINIRLQRINDSSVKWLSLVFDKLAQFISPSLIEINWHFNAQSKRLLMSGQHIQQQSKNTVNLLSHFGDRY
jgi:hypothetical protein